MLNVQQVPQSNREIKEHDSHRAVLPFQVGVGPLDHDHVFMMCDVSIWSRNKISNTEKNNKIMFRFTLWDATTHSYLAIKPFSPVSLHPYKRNATSVLPFAVSRNKTLPSAGCALTRNTIFIHVTSSSLEEVHLQMIHHKLTLSPSIYKNLSKISQIS